MSQPRSAPVSPRGRSFSPEFSQTYDFDGYAVRGLSHVLRAAEQQRKSQLKRLQHLKLAAERAAYQQQQAEMQQALEARKQELIQLDRKCKEESLAMSKAEAESKRQQTLRNSVVLYEDKRRQAEQKVVRVEQQAAKHNYVKEREAAIRRECASDRERYRQQVLSRNALIEEQKRQQAAMKGAEMEQQLRKRAKEQEVEERLKAEEHQRNERHRQWVLERAEMEAELKREQRLRAQAEKEYVVKRNQAEMEMELAARKQAMRRLDEERKAKAAHAGNVQSSSGRGGTVPSSTSSPASRKLSERQLELKLLIEREQGKEQARQALLRQVVDPAEKRRLIKIFTAEREKAKESILSLSFAGSNSGASNDEEVGLRKERK